MTPEQREALEAIKIHGTQRKAAEALGISRGAIRSRLDGARKYEDADPSIKTAMSSVGMQDAGVLHSGWIKTDSASLYFQMPKQGVSLDDTAQAIKDALEGVAPIPAVRGPQTEDTDLLTLYPIPDAHIGLYAWGDETGEDYDADTASVRIRYGIGQCLAASPASSEAIVVALGDTLHADDQTNQTPKSKHQLDVDTRHFRNMDIAIKTLAATIDAAMEKHGKVSVVVLPGNHDQAAYLGVLFALSERYRLNSRVSVQRKPGEFFVQEFGKCLIAAHHGDKAKAERITMYLADRWAEIWGRTRHRFLFTGHLHHHKSQDIGGVYWEQLRAVTAKDAYATAHAYSARAEMQAITFHKYRGEVSRVKVAL